MTKYTQVIKHAIECSPPEINQSNLENKQPTSIESIFEISDLSWKIADLLTHQNVFRLRCINRTFERHLGKSAYWSRRFKVKGYTQKFAHPRYAYVILSRYMMDPIITLPRYFELFPEAVDEPSRDEVDQYVINFVRRREGLACVIATVLNKRWQYMDPIAKVKWNDTAKYLMKAYWRTSLNRAFADQILIGGAMRGDLLIIEKSLKYGACITTDSIREAVRGRHRSVVVFLIRNHKSEPGNWECVNYALEVATKEGDIEMIADIIRLDPDDYTMAFENAIKNHHTQIVRFLFLQNNPTGFDFRAYIYEAMMLGFLDIVEVMLEYFCVKDKRANLIKMGDKKTIEDAFKVHSLELMLVAVRYQTRMSRQILGLEGDFGDLIRYIIEK